MNTQTLNTLIFLFLLTACSEEVELYGGLTEKEANESIATLVDRGIKADKKKTKGGISIMIMDDTMATAVNILNANGLPRVAQENLGEIFKKEGVISTPLEERARYIYALSQELEDTLSQIDGVIAARVHMVLPEKIAPGTPLLPSSAAVFIKHQNRLDPDVIRPRALKLLKMSIPGLAGERTSKIEVVFVPAKEAAYRIEWKNIGPFKVQKESFSTLLTIFLLMGTLLMALLAYLYYLDGEKIKTRFKAFVSR